MVRRAWQRSLSKYYTRKARRIRILNFYEAIKLYKLIKDHIPEVKDFDADASEFVSIIVKNMSSEPGLLADVLDMVTQSNLEDFKYVSPNDKLRILAVGLMENRIITLKYFFEGL